MSLPGNSVPTEETVFLLIMSGGKNHGEFFIARGLIICCLKITGESKLLPYFDWGVIIPHLIMTGESFLGESLLRVTPIYSFTDVGTMET